MASDFTAWTDTFDRANNASLGVNWTETGWSIASNVAASGNGEASWNKDTDRRAFGRDYYVQAAVVKTTTTDTTIGLTARVFTNLQINYYLGLVRMITGAANDQFEIWKNVAGVLTQLGSSVVQEWTDGDILRLEVEGNTVRLKSAPAADPANFTQHLSVTGDETNIPPWVNGTAGMRASSTGGSVNNWVVGFLTGVKNVVTKTVGAVTSTTAKIAFRASHACTVKVEYSTDSGLAGSTTTAGVAVDSTTDFTGSVTITGLAANTLYYFRLKLDDVAKGTATFATFRTNPTENVAASVTFAVGSCHGGHMPAEAETGDLVMGEIVADAPRFMLFLGDSIYADYTPDAADTIADLRARHHLWLSAGTRTFNYAKARRSFPWYYMVDDHEFQNNFDLGVSGAFYANGKQAWQEFSGRGNPAPYRAGVLYYAFQYGNIGLFVVDGRSYRSLNAATDNASKTILGATQKQDLKDWLLANKTALPIKVIASPTTTSAFGTTGTDSWGGGFTTELNEIRDYIIAQNIPGVIWVTGDQHWAMISQTVRSGVNFYEVMSSPVSMTNRTETASTDPAILFKYDNNTNYVLVTIDTTVSPATVVFSVRNNVGTEVGSLAITDVDINTGLDVEGPPPPPPPPPPSTVPRLRFLYDNNYSAPTTVLTASSAAPALPVGASQNPDRSYIWRSLSQAGVQTIEIDFGSSLACAAVAVANVKLAGAGVLELYRRGTASTPGTAVLVTTLSAQDRDTRTAFAFFISVSARHWQLKFTHPPPANDYAELGHCFLGPYVEMTRNIRVPATIARPDPSVASASVDGQKTFRRRTKYFVGEWEFLEIAEAQLTDLRTIFDSIGVGTPHYVVLDSTISWMSWFTRLVGGLRTDLGQIAGRYSVGMGWEEVR